MRTVFLFLLVILGLSFTSAQTCTHKLKGHGTNHAWTCKGSSCATGLKGTWHCTSGVDSVSCNLLSLPCYKYTSSTGRCAAGSRHGSIGYSTCPNTITEPHCEIADRCLKGCIKENTIAGTSTDNAGQIFPVVGHCIGDKMYDVEVKACKYHNPGC
jgi:hypothetical protein